MPLAGGGVADRSGGHTDVQLPVQTISPPVSPVWWYKVIPSLSTRMGPNFGFTAVSTRADPDVEVVEPPVIEWTVFGSLVPQAATTMASAVTLTPCRCFMSNAVPLPTNLCCVCLETTQETECHGTRASWPWW